MRFNDFFLGETGFVKNFKTNFREWGWGVGGGLPTLLQDLCYEDDEDDYVIIVNYAVPSRLR